MKKTLELLADGMYVGWGEFISDIIISERKRKYWYYFNLALKYLLAACTLLFLPVLLFVDVEAGVALLILMPLLYLAVKYTNLQFFHNFAVEYIKTRLYPKNQARRVQINLDDEGYDILNLDDVDMEEVFAERDRMYERARLEKMEGNNNEKN